MGFDVGFNAGSSAFEAIEAEEFVGNELKIAWDLEGNEFAEKGNDRGGPGAPMVAAAGFDLKSLAVLEPASSKLVEAGFSYMEKLAGFCNSNATGIEFMKILQNELAWESAGGLAFFIAPIDRIKLLICDHHWPSHLESPYSTQRQLLTHLAAGLTTILQRHIVR